jgi:isopentenyldiphosphate isomerase
MTEMIDVLDSDGNPTGRTKEKNAVHRDGDWHREVRVWVIKDKFEVLLQRRAMSKKIHPGRLSVSAGGHVSAGESMATAAARETLEELGVALRPEYLGTFKYAERDNDSITNAFFGVFLITHGPDVSEFRIQTEELDEVLYAPLSFIKDSLENEAGNVDFGHGEYGMLMDAITQIKAGTFGGAKRREGR